MSTREEWEWFGTASHLIVGAECRFHLATVIGPWLVSTVGEWLPHESSWDDYAEHEGVVLTGRGDDRRNQFLREVGYVEIGAGRKYETMVFRVGAARCTQDDCDCGAPIDVEFFELDFDGYNLRGDAQRGHLAMCEKWAALPVDPEYVS